ncbi:MAG: hypothetical protein ACK5F0_10010 [Flavobacteriales bacterium]
MSSSKEDTEKKILEKQMSWIIDMLKETNYIISVKQSQIKQLENIAWYTFNIIDPELSSKTEHHIVSSVSISIKKNALILIPRKGSAIITRNTEAEPHDVFHIELVETPFEHHRGNGWATLLLIYAMSYLKILQPYTYIKFFTLNDESSRNTYIEENIYNRLGFVFMYEQSMDPYKTGRVESTDTTKLLNFNKESVVDWVNRCIGLINETLIKWGMEQIDAMGRKNQKKQKNKKTKKQKTKNKKTKNKKTKKQKTKKQKTKNSKK